MKTLDWTFYQKLQIPSLFCFFFLFNGLIELKFGADMTWNDFDRTRCNSHLTCHRDSIQQQAFVDWGGHGRDCNRISKLTGVRPWKRLPAYGAYTRVIMAALDKQQCNSPAWCPHSLLHTKTWRDGFSMCSHCEGYRDAIWVGSFWIPLL